MRLKLETVATTYGKGPFHPAIRTGTLLHYWPNVTMEHEDEAYRFANLALKDAMAKAHEQAAQWNIYPVL